MELHRAHKDESSIFANRNETLLGRISFYGVLLAIALSSVPWGTVDPWLMQMFVFVVCVCGFCRVGDGMIAGNLRFGDPKLLLPILAILALAVFQIWHVWTISVDPVETRNSILRLAGYLISAEILFHYTNSTRRLRAVLTVVLTVGVAAVLFGLIRHLLLSTDLPRLPVSTGFGQFINRNHFAFLNEMFLGVLVGLLLRADLRPALKLAAGTAAGLSLIAQITVNSRGGVLALVGIGIFAIALLTITSASQQDRVSRRSTPTRFLSVKKLVLVSVLIISFTVVAAFTVAFIGGDPVATRIETIQTEFRSPPEGNLRRLDFWRSTIEVIKEYPITGAGFGAYPAVITRHDQSSGRSILQQAHNDYLDLAANGGFLTVTLAIVFFFILGKRTLRNVSSTDRLRASIAFGSTLGIMGVLLHSLVDFGLRTTINANVFILLLVLAAASVDRSSFPDQYKPRSSWRAAFEMLPFVIYYGAILLMSVMCFRIGTSFYFSDQAARLKSTASADRAIYFDASNYEAFQIRGKLKQRDGNDVEAIGNFQRAVNLRPADYMSRLQLAAAYATAGYPQNALQACRQAQSLAPHYAGPLWFMGFMYLKEKDYDAAFNYLDQAAGRDLTLLPTLLDLAQNTLFNDALIDRAIQPSTLAAKIIAANYYISHNIESEKSASFLTGASLSDEEKDKFIKRLIDVRKFPQAFDVWRSEIKNNRQQLIQTSAILINGGFEDDLPLDEVGFGWQINPKTTNIVTTITREAPASSTRAIEIEFKGNSAPSDPILSQLVLVRSEHPYRLTFAIDVLKMDTGGLPVITVLDATTGQTLAETPPLGPTNGNWKYLSLDVRSGPLTRAVIIKLTRRPCPQSPCPAFGVLRLDDLELR